MTEATARAGDQRGQVSNDFAALQRRLTGLPLPGGTFTVAEHERWLAHDAMKSPRLADGQLHPVWIVLGALRGLGMTIEELVGLAGAASADGALFGETTLEQLTPLRADLMYAVSGVVTGITRRTGRRAGVMDLMTIELTLTEPDGTPAAVSLQTFILMRENPSP